MTAYAFPITAETGPQRVTTEALRCRASSAYFTDTYCQIYDATARDWQPFRLWTDQYCTLKVIRHHDLVVILKARQLGLTWLVVAYALWQMLLKPAATVLLFSRRDDEATYLLDFRLRGMYDRLPDWLRCRGTVVANSHELRLSNGSTALAFPTTGGRSYTASLAVVDEADYMPDLDTLLNAVKPTVDAGGQLILLSTTDKSQPESPFKRIYRAAVAGENAYAPVFLPWQARPDRTPAWYAEQQADVQARTGSTDDLYQEYPATDGEALAPRSLDKRFPFAWLSQCDKPQKALPAGPAIEGLAVYRKPDGPRNYLIGADPAEGNPQSDESAASVVETRTGEQMAMLAGRFDPAVFAGHLKALSDYYNKAPALVERNNHGHAVLLWLREFSRVACLQGLDGRPGWVTSGSSKPLALDHAADVLRDRGTIIHDAVTMQQLSSIEGSTLAAPAGQHDDRAMAHILTLAGLRFANGNPRARVREY